MNTKDYIDLRIEQLRLKGSKTASRALGSLLSWMLIIAVASLTLLVLAFAGVLLLGKALDNYSLGALIVGGILLLVLIICFLLKGRMFRGTFVRMLSGKKNYEELLRSEEITSLRLQDAESDVAGLGNIGFKTMRILLRLISRK